MSDTLYTLLNHCPAKVWNQLSVQMQQMFIRECFRRNA